MAEIFVRIAAKVKCTEKLHLDFSLTSLASASSFKDILNLLFMFFLFVGEVSPSAATPRCARVCVYPLRGDTPRRPVQFLASINVCPCPSINEGSSPRNAPRRGVRAGFKPSLDQNNENQASV